jgi:hypothetical protein
MLGLAAELFSGKEKQALLFEESSDCREAKKISLNLGRGCCKNPGRCHGALRLLFKRRPLSRSRVLSVRLCSPKNALTPFFGNQLYRTK